MTRDPHQALGLTAGATAAEVKRAYRRLAKEHHPDSAGEKALPRFLEIQRAYEQLSSPAWRPGAKRPAATEPWRADPARARSTPGAQPPGGTSAGGMPGARSPGGDPRRADGAQRAPGGASRAAGGARRASGGGQRAPGGAAGTAGGGSRGDEPDGSGPGPGTASSAGSTPGSGPRSDGTAGRRRPARKATFGSTTYDEARAAADPAWSGASWYGPTSGEYWQVNPREYADPRKHGPEYLARAAARAGASAERHASEDGGDPPAPRAPGEPGPAATYRRPAAANSGPGPGDEQRAARASVPRDRSWPSRPAQPIRSQRAAAAATAAQPTADTGVPGGAEGVVGASAMGAGGIAAGSVTVNDQRSGLTRSPALHRVLGALAAWPPLGIAAAALIGRATGCAAFEASCTPPAHLYPWFAQGAIVLGLLVAPTISRILAGGTAAVAILAFPVVAALSAAGATYDRARGPAALVAVLGVAWLAGVVAMLLRRSGRRVAP